MFSLKRSSADREDSNTIDTPAKCQKTATRATEQATIEAAIGEATIKEATMDKAAVGEAKAEEAAMEVATIDQETNNEADPKQRPIDGAPNLLDYTTRDAAEVTFEEAGRQAMIAVIGGELDKLDNDFEVLVRAHKAIEEYANFTKEVIRDGCLQLSGADALSYTPEPPTLKKIADSIGKSTATRRWSDYLEQLDNRVMYDLVSAIDEGHAVLWKLKLSVGHAISSWPAFKRDAISRALQEATPEELLHISNTFGLRIEEQGAMLNEIFKSSEGIIIAHKSFRSRIVSEGLQYKRSHTTEDALLQDLDSSCSQKVRHNKVVLAAVQRLHNYKLGELYSKSSTQLFRFQKFMENKEFNRWKGGCSTSVRYLGSKALFKSFHKDLVKVTASSLRLPEEMKGEDE
jgi:hypothetical protein